MQQKQIIQRIESSSTVIRMKFKNTFCINNFQPQLKFFFLFLHNRWIWTILLKSKLQAQQMWQIQRQRRQPPQQVLLRQQLQ